MKFSEFEEMLKNSKLISEINSCIQNFNETVSFNEILADHDFNLYATLTSLSNEAKKELIYLVKGGFLSIRIGIIYHNDKVQYELHINIKQESRLHTIIKEHVCIIIPYKLFMEIFNLLVKCKLDFMLMSENLDNDDIYLEEEKKPKIFTEYKDIDYDEFMDEIGDDYYEEDDSF